MRRSAALLDNQRQSRAQASRRSFDILPLSIAQYTKQLKFIKQLRISLDKSSDRFILRVVRHGGKRPRRKRSKFVGQPSELGALLTDLRTAKGLSLREVEAAAGRAVSNAYLSQLEKGKIKKPSPNVLHSLADVYVVPYEALMEKAGYLHRFPDGAGPRQRPAAFAIEDLTAEEEQELLRYLAFLRSRAAPVRQKQK